MSKQIMFIGSLLFLTSCSGWTDADKVAFVDKCEKAKFNYEYCECALNKSVENYGSLEEALADEVEFGELAATCIDKDRIEDSKDIK